MPIAPIEIGGNQIGVHTGERFREKTEPFFWPLVGDYPVYDKYIYAVMTADDDRARAYRDAIRGMAEGRTVVEIGTGDQAHWARSCARAGARKVFAIESNTEALEKASSIVSNEGLAEIVTFLSGTSTDLELPEKADFSVSEIIGEIGGSEGAAAILNDVRRRLLNPDASCIPSKCLSWCCPIQLPAALRDRPLIEKMGIPYVQKIFELAGNPFDLRLTIDNCFDELPGCLLSEPRVLEEMDFDGLCEESWTRRLSFVAKTSGDMNGLLIWIELFVGEESPPLSSMKAGSNWRPVFCPLFDPGIELVPGDCIEIDWRTSLPSGHTHPDYAITCTITSAGREKARTVLQWPHLGNRDTFRQNAFYRRLFPDLPSKLGPFAENN